MRLVGDAFFALVSRLSSKVAPTLLFVVLMRQSGELAAGTYSLSIAFLTSGVLLSSFGLEELIVRDVAMTPSLSRRYLINMLFLRGVLSIVGYGAVAGIVFLLPKYDLNVRFVILFQSLGMLPEGLKDTLFSVFSAEKRLHWMALVSACAGVFQVVVGGAALYMGGSLALLVGITLAGSMLGLITSVYLALRLPDVQQVPVVGGRSDWRLDWALCKRQIKAAVPFAVMVALVSIDLQVDVISLSALRGVEAVGVYSAARSIVLFLALLPRTFRIAIYPPMARACATSVTELRRIYRESWWYLAVIGFPLVVGGILVSRQIVELVYGATSVQAVWSLRVLMVYLLVLFLYIPSTRLMVASNCQIRLSWLLGLSLGFSLLASILLVPHIGAVGTALSRVISSVLYWAAVELFVWRSILPRHGGFRAALKPALSTIPMAAVIWFLIDKPLHIVVPVGVVSYAIALLALYGFHFAERGLGLGFLREWLSRC